MCSQLCCFKLILCKSMETESEEDLLTLAESELIQEPGLIFSSSALGDITPGTSFYITGTILKNCERFSVNLTLGTHQKDIALHINPRLPQNYIVRNYKINGNWGIEEVTSALPFSLNRGQKFAMQVLVTESNYFISVNGHHFASFTHRVPYNRVKCLQVKGDVIDVQVEQLSVMEYPDKLPESETHIVKIYDGVYDIEKFMELPYYGKLSDNFKTGNSLHIIGRVKILPHSFFINLQKGDKIWPHPTIAFHLNPRFANVGGRHIICKNSWFDGKWDREQRSEIHTDFMPGRTFHMSINCRESAYHVYLNKKLIAEYHFRLEPNVVDTVYIEGDIKLQMVALETVPFALQGLDIA